MILLDIDDTLINHSKACELATIQFHAKYQEFLPYKSSEFYSVWQKLSDKHFDRFLGGELTVIEQRRERLRDMFNIDFSPSELDKIYESYLTYYSENWELFPDVIPFLEKCKQHDIKLGIVSDGGETQQIKKLKQCGIYKYFVVILTAEKTGLSKPSPKFFKLACDKASSNINNSFYIGDLLEKDAKGASGAGLTGVWLNRKNIQKQHSVEEINSLNEFNFNLLR